MLRGARSIASQRMRSNRFGLLFPRVLFRRRPAPSMITRPDVKITVASRVCLRSVKKIDYPVPALRLYVAPGPSFILAKPTTGSFFRVTTIGRGRRSLEPTMEGPRRVPPLRSHILSCNPRAGWSEAFAGWLHQKISPYVVLRSANPLDHDEELPQVMRTITAAVSPFDTRLCPRPGGPMRLFRFAEVDKHGIGSPAHRGIHGLIPRAHVSARVFHIPSRVTPFILLLSISLSSLVLLSPLGRPRDSTRRHWRSAS